VNDNRNKQQEQHLISHRSLFRPRAAFSQGEYCASAPGFFVIDSVRGRCITRASFLRRWCDLFAEIANSLRKLYAANTNLYFIFADGIEALPQLDFDVQLNFGVNEQS
jgi:hypothetical protein